MLAFSLKSETYLLPLKIGRIKGSSLPLWKYFKRVQYFLGFKHLSLSWLERSKKYGFLLLDIYSFILSVKLATICRSTSLRPWLWYLEKHESLSFISPDRFFIVKNNILTGHKIFKTFKAHSSMIKTWISIRLSENRWL